jgi:hypothetical protein
VTTGNKGQFVFERVFPGTGRIGRRILFMVDSGTSEAISSSQVSASFAGGETTTIDLGGTGTAVVGKLVPADEGEKMTWNLAIISARADLSPPPPPKPPKEVDGDEKKRVAWWEAWKVTGEGLAWTASYEVYQQLVASSPSFSASVARDGSFRIDDMPAGSYVLNVTYNGNWRRQSERRFVVPAAEGATGPVDLGELRLR